jgi:bacillithiol biosynthesis cysteine-adding enzyme BshC
MNWIDYRQLLPVEGAFTRLFVDYVTDHQQVRKYYGSDFRSDAEWQTLLGRVTSRAINRSPLAQILSEQNRNFHCGVRTLANIDALLNENTVAVVTGQQIGLFTGPLYTIYKTITTIKLAESLGAKFPAYTFVPVFWLEGEDHDVDEVSSVQVLSATQNLLRLTYPPPQEPGAKNSGAVADIEFSAPISALLEQLDQSLIQSEFHANVLDLIRAAYQPGMTFIKAFVHLMNVLFEDKGLIFLNPHDSAIKRILAPVFRKEIAESPRTCQLVIEQSEELEKHYHAQAKPRSLNLFVFHGTGRFPLEPHPDGYSLKGTRQHFTSEQIQNALDQTPEIFSPNVVLRPIAQDYLLPTIAYVAGPAEVAYFAQLKSVYESFQIPMPIIFPRASVTLLEERIEKVLTRFNLFPIDLLQEIEFIKRNVTQQISEFRAEALFVSTQGTIEESLNSIRTGLHAIDPTLVGALDNTISKMKGNLDVLREKTIAAQQRQHEVALRQIEKAALSLFPNSNFQERELNVIYFLNKYGLEFVRWLVGEIEIDKFQHQIIRL